MISRRMILAGTAAGALLPAWRAAFADTLQAIQSKGVVRVAVLNSFPPFGSVGPAMQLLGLDIDLIRILGQKLGVKVDMVPTTGSAQNIPMLQTGKVDMIAAGLGETPERAKVIAFSIPYALTYNAVYCRPDLSVSKPSDLASRSVSAPRGGTEDIEFTKVAPPNTDIKRFEDNTTVFSAYSSGQVDCFVTGNTTAAAIAKTSSRPFKLALRLNDEPTHIAVRRGDQALLNKINAILGELRSNGTLSKLSEKWLGSPLPNDLK